jgi:hypothetical protein
MGVELVGCLMIDERGETVLQSYNIRAKEGCRLMLDPIVIVA